MNKPDLIDRVAYASGHSPDAVRSVMSAIVAVVKSAVKRGEIVRLFGLGKLYVASRASKPARNLHTGDSVEVPPRTVVLFKASKDLQREANS